MAMRVVEIEATNYCNTRCLHCPHEAMGRPSGMMTWDTFRVVADKIMAHGVIESVDFAGMGEPMLNPNLYRFIEYLSEDIETYITTNASVLTSRNIERLIDSGLAAIIVSFNGADAKLYERMTGGLSFERAESYVVDLMQRAEGSMRVIANVSVTKQTETQLKRIKTYLNGLGIGDISFSKCHSRGGHLRAPDVCDTPMPPAKTGRCDIFDSTLFVSWTGDVLACCHDLDGVGSLGSLLTESVEEILRHKQAVLERGLSYEMCGHCNDLYRFLRDRLPGNTRISEWAYSLYLEPSERTDFLNRVVQSQHKQLEDLSLQLEELESLIADYEEGRVLSCLRRFGFCDYYEHNNQPNQQSELEGGDGASQPSGDVSLMDWMSLLCRQIDESMESICSRIRRQERRIEKLTRQTELAEEALTAYRHHPFIRAMDEVTSWRRLVLPR